MPGPVIKVENISKQYRLGQVGTGSLNHDLNRLWHRVRRKEDPYLKIGETNDRTRKGSSEYVWALKDISFEVQAGEVLGIIGRNGAGKSTLLKILSRTTTPTAGSIKMKGRVASLLEVGTGFHADLSGRENIYLNGAILGMRRVEIDRKLDEIINFAGVERYIDTPVKRYSSGMYVRLAFAVAAHLEPEILIVDEVLAVGDAEFQKKCLGKMKDVSTREGRTVLFVSHNMTAVHQLCDTGILMKEGAVHYAGRINEVLEEYASNETESNYTALTKTEKEIQITSILTQVSELDGKVCLMIMLKIDSKSKDSIAIDFRIQNATGIPVAFSSAGTLDNKLVPLSPGENTISVALQISALALGKYTLSIDTTKPNLTYYERLDNVVGFSLTDTLFPKRKKLQQHWNYGSIEIDSVLHEYGEKINSRLV